MRGVGCRGELPTGLCGLIHRGPREVHSLKIKSTLSASAFPRQARGCSRGCFTPGPLSWEGLGRGLTSLEFLRVSLWRPVRKSSSACWAHRCSLRGGRGRGVWEGEEEGKKWAGARCSGEEAATAASLGRSGVLSGFKGQGQSWPPAESPAPTHSASASHTVCAWHCAEWELPKQPCQQEGDAAITPILEMGKLTLKPPSTGSTRHGGV